MVSRKKYLSFRRWIHLDHSKVFLFCQSISLGVHRGRRVLHILTAVVQGAHPGAAPAVREARGGIEGQVGVASDRRLQEQWNQNRWGWSGLLESISYRLIASILAANHTSFCLKPSIRKSASQFCTYDACTPWTLLLLTSPRASCSCRWTSDCNLPHDTLTLKPAMYRTI